MLLNLRRILLVFGVLVPFFVSAAEEAENGERYVINLLWFSSNATGNINPIKLSKPFACLACLGKPSLLDPDFNKMMKKLDGWRKQNPNADVVLWFDSNWEGTLRDGELLRKVQKLGNRVSVSDLRVLPGYQPDASFDVWNKINLAISLVGSQGQNKGYKASYYFESSIDCFDIANVDLKARFSKKVFMSLETVDGGMVYRIAGNPHLSNPHIAWQLQGQTKEADEKPDNYQGLSDLSLEYGEEVVFEEEV